MFDPSLRRLPAAALLDFARTLLVASGLPGDRAQDVADVLLEGDLLGHSTHGVALNPDILPALLPCARELTVEIPSVLEG